MSLLIPQFTREEQMQRLKEAQKKTLFPYSTVWNRLVNNTNYPTVDSAGGGQYYTAQLVSPNAAAIEAIGITNIIQQGGDFFIVAVSYAPTFSAVDTNGSLVIPDDAGNIIYRAQFINTNYVTTDYRSWEPDNHYLEANRPIYIHQWVTAAAITAATMVLIGSVTLYLKQTGFRS